MSDPCCSNSTLPAHITCLISLLTGPRSMRVSQIRSPRLSGIRLFGTLALALALILGLQPAIAQTRATGMNPAPKAPPVQWPRSHNYHVKHYKIELSIDMPGKSIAGQTIVTLNPFKSDLSEIDLDAGEMKISSVRLATGAPLKFRYEDQEKLYVELGHPYPSGGDVSIAIEASAKQQTGLAFV